MASSVRVIAHRGARAFAPENTLAAIDKAAATCADAVEIDVQLTADGQAVVFHDDDLSRCTDVRVRFPRRDAWLLHRFTLPELRQLDAGSWFADELQRPRAERQAFLRSLTDEEHVRWIRAEELERYRSGAVGVPTLVECLEACRAHGLGVHVELKAIPRFPPALVDVVLAAIAAVDMEDRVVLSSFDHQQLARVRERGSRVRTAVLTGDRLHDPVTYLSRLGANAYNPGCSGAHDTMGLEAADGPDRESVGALRRAGFDVHAWTENDPLRMRRLIELGVNGIFTDYPNRLCEVVGRVRTPDRSGGAAGCSNG